MSSKEDMSLYIYIDVHALYKHTYTHTKTNVKQAKLWFLDNFVIDKLSRNYSLCQAILISTKMIPY